MKFRSPTKDPVHIGLTSGHTTVVTHEGVELPKIFHREAVARGCLPEGVSAEAAPVGDAGFERKRVIADALNAMLDGGVEGDFKNDGTPVVNKVIERVGFKVTREEVDAVWAEVSKDEKAD